MSEPKMIIPEKKAKDEIQFVNKYTKPDLAITAFIVGLLSFIGGLFFALLVLLSFPAIGLFGFLSVGLLFLILSIVLAVGRNHIIEWIFGKISHEHYLSFVIFWKRYPWLVIAISFLLGSGMRANSTYLLYALTFLFMSTPIYFVFEKPLSNRGGIEVVFEGLFSSINNFYERQYYLKIISKTIEQAFRMGNIAVTSNDLIYNFNRKLLETNEDISDDLRNIKAWMSGEQRTCLDSLKKIIPEIKIEPYTKISFFRRVLANPTPIQADLIKFFAILIAAVIVLLVRPELINSAINLVKGLLGM